MKYLGPILFLSIALLGAWRWRRRGWRVPRFVHVLALVGIVLGAWMAWLDSTVGEFRWTRATFEVCVMPFLVYVGFFAYSGRLVEHRDSSGEAADADDQAAV